MMSSSSKENLLHLFNPHRRIEDRGATRTEPGTESTPLSRDHGVIRPEPRTEPAPTAEASPSLGCTHSRLSPYVSTRTAEIHHSMISPDDLSAMGDVYKTYTLLVLDWLKRVGSTPSFASTCEPHTMTELEILRLAKAVGLAKVPVPDDVMKAWEESIGMRQQVLRYEKARCEVWDTKRQKDIETYEGYIQTLRMAKERVWGKRTRTQAKATD